MRKTHSHSKRCVKSIQSGYVSSEVIVCLWMFFKVSKNWCVVWFLKIYSSVWKLISYLYRYKLWDDWKKKLKSNVLKIEKLAITTPWFFRKDIANLEKNINI